MNDSIKVTSVGFLGFISQLTSIDLLLKVAIGLATLIYIVGKTVKMFRDWNRKDGE